MDKLDNKKRCFGGSELYDEYHDQEWGVPSHDDRHLFEMLILEGTQAGLKWEMVLKKREAYRKLFHNFDPIKVAAMGDNELEDLCQNRDIIRNRLKIYSARNNAQVFLRIQAEYGSFDDYVWKYSNGGSPIINRWQEANDVPSTTPASEALSKDLKKRGMKFVGPTIMYAFMQSIGMVNDHHGDCWLM